MSGQKVTSPTWHQTSETCRAPTGFRSLNHTFSFPVHMPSALCRLPGKFGWDPFSSLAEIADEGRAPRTGRRVGTNSPTFLWHGLADFCVFHHFVHNLTGQNHTALMDVMWTGTPKNRNFCSPTWPPTDFRRLTHIFIASHLLSSAVFQKSSFK